MAGFTRLSRQHGAVALQRKPETMDHEDTGRSLKVEGGGQYGDRIPP